ncbi:MAG: hypothetical protein Q8L59_11015 [Phenylobacterium sp.]|nr:hypothetical protein [Phenylobacterium sp.]
MLAAPLVHGAFRGEPRRETIISTTIMADNRIMADRIRMTDHG